MSYLKSLGKTSLPHLALPALQPVSKPVSKPVSPSSSLPSTIVLNFNDPNSIQLPFNANPQYKNKIPKINSKPKPSRRNSKPSRRNSKPSRRNSKPKPSKDKNANRQKLSRLRNSCIKVGLCIYHWDHHDQLLTDVEMLKECMKHKNQILGYF